MKKFFRNVGLVVVALAVYGCLAGTAGAAIINDNRPVTPAGDWLQFILDANTVSETKIDVVNDQIKHAIFTDTASGGSIASFVIEVESAGGVGEGNDVFGMYKYGDVTKKLVIFASNEGAGDRAFVSFDDDGLASVIVRDSDGAYGIPREVSGFGDVFGFYLDVLDDLTGELTTTVYSEDELNPSGSPGALILAGDGTVTMTKGTFSANEYIVAFDDFTSPPADFADVVVLVESIEPIPEPVSILVWSLLAGTVGITACWRRRARPK